MKYILILVLLWINAGLIVSAFDLATRGVVEHKREAEDAAYAEMIAGVVERSAGQHE